MRLFYTLLIFSLLHTPQLLISQNLNPEKIAHKLMNEMTEAPDAFHSVHVVLSDQVDLEALDKKLSEEKANPSRRSEVVISALKDKAAESQPVLLEILKSSPLAKPGSVANFWISNIITAELKSELIALLSNKKEVAWIGLNEKIMMMDSESSCPAPPVQPNSHEIGLTVIGAPFMWNLGYTGYGQLTFTNDTGVDPKHQALNASYRGNSAPIEQSFFQYDQATQAQIPNLEAFDCQQHGTHVTGTILGLDRLANDTIGVAFNAQWIGAATLLECGGGLEGMLAAFQWSMDPDGNPATSDDMPDVINNSWGNPNSDISECMGAYPPMFQALEAAGIAVVFAAGNEGPGPSTLRIPANYNNNLVNTFAVGAVNGNNPNLPIADFSSRGPTLCVANDSSLIIKPEVSAPGVSVRSSVPGNGYEYFQGTSMAAPHVSGAILLLKEAFPYLTGKELELALYFSALDLGVPGEDNTYGMGIINLPAAFNYLVAQGNVPADPHVNLDVFVVDLKVPETTCETEVSPMILTVENGGATPLTSFEILYQAGASSYNLGWVGHLEQSERATIQLPTLAADPGDYRFKVTLLNPNGVADERPLNNSIERNLTILDRKRLQVQPEGTPVACEGSSVLLRAEYDGPGYATVKWYDEPFGGTAIHQGMIYTTPPLAEADTLYAEAVYTLPGGLKDKNSAPSELLEDEEVGLVFDALRPFKLKSVKVFAEQTGLRQFILLSENGEELEHTVVNVNQVGEFVFNLNWEIPASNNLQIIKNGGKGLYSNTAETIYPIEQPGVVKIKGTTTGDDNIYYFFYDWQMEFPEVCERTKVIIPVSGAGSSPGASFSISADSIDLTSNQSIVFTNTSTANAISFDWNFGDGTGSTQESPTHQYTEPGVYIVSLAITSLDGCSSFALDTIEVTNNGVSGADPGRLLPENIAVYPNPASESVKVQLDLHQAKDVELIMTDMTGKTVRTMKRFTGQNETLELATAELCTGVYFLSVKMEGYQSVWKVVKI